MQHFALNVRHTSAGTVLRRGFARGDGSFAHASFETPIAFEAPRRRFKRTGDGSYGHEGTDS